MSRLTGTLRAVLGSPGSVRRILTSTAFRYGIKGAVVFGLVTALGLSIAAATALYVAGKITYTVAVAVRNREDHQEEA